MAVELPSTPAPNGATATLLDYGAIQRPATGGAAQRIDRPGSRFRIDVGFPPMPNATTGRIFLARLLRSLAEGITLDFPLLGVSQGIPGSPLVDGAGQSGTTLNVKGCTPDYSVKEGFWLSITNGTRHYLHNVAAPAVADATGDIILTLTPALRFPFADNAVIELAKPVIDGFVVGEEWAWQMDLAHHLGLAVTIEEWG